MSEKSYHHGNLREALIAGAIQVIEEQDVAAVSLRKVARRLGVTNAAPYHHFRDKTALLAAVAAEGFRNLDAAAQRAAEANPDPWDALHALGLAYITTAIHHPAHYQVMFRSDLHELEDDDLETRSRDAFGHLVAALEGIRDALGAPGPVMPLALFAWSAVHGFASLWTQGALAKKAGLASWEPAAHGILTLVNQQVRAELGSRLHPADGSSV